MYIIVIALALSSFLFFILLVNIFYVLIKLSFGLLGCTDIPVLSLIVSLLILLISMNFFRTRVRGERHVRDVRKVT